MYSLGIPAVFSSSLTSLLGLKKSPVPHHHPSPSPFEPILFLNTR